MTFTHINLELSFESSEDDMSDVEEFKGKNFMVNFLYLKVTYIVSSGFL